MLLAQSSFVVRPALGLVLLAMVGLTQAQQPATAEPTKLPEFRVSYRSPIGNYQGFSDPVLTSWKESNDLVSQIGGWRAYARESLGGANLNPSIKSERVDPHAGHGESRR